MFQSRLMFRGHPTRELASIGCGYGTQRTKELLTFLVTEYFERMVNRYVFVSVCVVLTIWKPGMTNIIVFN